MLSVMPNVIEKSVRTVVMHGGVDYVLIAEGTRWVPVLFQNDITFPYQTFNAIFVPNAELLFSKSPRGDLLCWFQAQIESNNSSPTYQRYV